MLSREDNELMCRVGPGTAMGAAMRRYWLPALQSSDLPAPDCDPQHVELLGEHFVAFRDTHGRVGILDEHCCHRGASLLLARVEECGIRCIYHGWKFSVDGTVLDTPNVPDPKFKTRFKARAWPVREAGGLVWVYLGPAEDTPSFPEWGWLSLPDAHRLVTAHGLECNFVQILEGLVDSSHLGLLHSNALVATGESDLTFASKVAAMQSDLAPRIEVEETAFGFHYAALRLGAEGRGEQRIARITAFVAPCVVLNPNGDVATIVVPANDERSIFFHVFWDQERKIGEEPLRSEQLRFIGLDAENAGPYGILREQEEPKDLPSRRNHYRQNREAMRRGTTFSGLPGLIEEDVAVSVSAAAIRDREQEMLSISDAAVAMLYRVLLKSARWAQSGAAPVGAGADKRSVAGTSGSLNPGENWRSLVPHHEPAGSSSSEAVRSAVRPLA